MPSPSTLQYTTVHILFFLVLQIARADGPVPDLLRRLANFRRTMRFVITMVLYSHVSFCALRTRRMYVYYIHVYIHTVLVRCTRNSNILTVQMFKDPPTLDVTRFSGSLNRFALLLSRVSTRSRSFTEHPNR